MTNEEAKQWIEWIKRKYIHGGDEEFDYKRKIALDMAIKALEQDPQETVTEFADRCRECGKMKRCKDCKYFEYDSVAKVDGIPLIVAHEICSKWGDGCKTSEDGYCFLFEPKEEEGKE